MQIWSNKYIISVLFLFTKYFLQNNIVVYDNTN